MRDVRDVIVTIKQVIGSVKAKLVDSTGADVTAANPLPVTGTVTGTVPLPTGAATAALQTTGNASLSTIASKDFATQTTLATRASEATLALVKTAIDSVNTALASQATAALQTTGNGLLTDIKANQTNATQKSQRVDGSGNVAPAGDTQARGVNVIMGDGTNKVDSVAIGDAVASKRGILMMGALPTGAGRIFNFVSSQADALSNGYQAALITNYNVGFNGTSWDRLRTVNTGQLVVTQKDSSGNEAAIMDTPARRGYNQQSDQYGNIAECTNMGDLRSVTPVRLVGSQFDGTTVDSNFWTATVSTIGAGDGTVTQGSAQAVLTSGTANAAFSTLNSVRRSRYVGGVGIRYMGVIQLGDTGTANNTRKWGVAWGATMPTISDGAYFQVSGTTFSIVTLKNGTPSVVNSGSFNGTVAAYTLTTNAATYEIYWTNSKVQFVINDVLIHTVTASSATWADTMGHHVYMDNRNTGILGAGVTLSCRTATIYRLGEIVTQPTTYYFAAGTTAGVNLKLGAGNIRTIIINNALNNAVITLSDSTSAATPAIFVHTAGATYTGPEPVDMHGAPFYNGLRLTVSGANASVTVVYE